jgi:hypothetical protein
MYIGKKNDSCRSTLGDRAACLGVPLGVCLFGACFCSRSFGKLALGGFYFALHSRESSHFITKTLFSGVAVVVYTHDAPPRALLLRDFGYFLYYTTFIPKW